MIFAQISVLILFLFMVYFFSKQNIDTAAYTLFASIIAGIIVVLSYNLEIDAFLLENIPITLLIFLICMDVLITMVRKEHIYQYLAIKIIHLTKGNIRLFFYVINIVCALASAFMEDMPLTLIFIPLVLRTARILEIKSKPFIISISLSISIGNLLSPFSCSSNILIASLFNLNLIWFFSRFILLFIIILLITLIIIDFKMLRKQDPPSERQKTILMEIMDPKLIIIDRNKFIRYTLYFISIITLLVIIPYPFIVAMIGIFAIVIFEKTTIDMDGYFKRVDWKIIIILSSIFIMIGALSVTGYIDLFSGMILIITGDNFIFAIIIVAVFSSIIASLTSNALTIIMFSNVLKILFANTFISLGTQDVLVMALILGIDLGSHLLPQTSTRNVKTYDLSKEFTIHELKYKTYLGNIIIFTIIYIVIGMLYIFLLSVFV